MKINIVLALMFLVSPVVFATENIDEIIREVTSAEVRDFSTRDFGRDRFAEAKSVIVNKKGSRSILYNLRKKLPKGYVAYIGTTRNLGSPKVNGHELVVIKSNDRFEILSTAQSDGINYGITNRKIIEKLKAWHEKYGIDIWQVETDTIQFTINNMPTDTLGFAKEIYKFCPDIVDQGAGDIEALEKHLKASNEIYLWWD